MLALWWLTVGFAGPITRPLSSRHASPLVAAGPARFGSVRLPFLLPQLSAVWLIVVLSSPSPWGVGGVCWKREPGFFSAGSKKRALELLVPFRTRALKLLQEAAERPPKAGGATPPFWRVAPLGGCSADGVLGGNRIKFPLQRTGVRGEEWHTLRNAQISKQRLNLSRS